MKNTLEHVNEKMTEYQSLCRQVKNQKGVVAELGRAARRLVATKRWESVLTPEEKRVAKRECTEAAEEYMEELDMLDAMQAALKSVGDKVLAELWSGNQAA